MNSDVNQTNRLISENVEKISFDIPKVIIKSKYLDGKDAPKPSPNTGVSFS